MSFSSSMFVARRSVLVALVLMMTFLRWSGAMPQCNNNDAEIINIIAENERNAEGCKCMNFNECGDEKEDFLGLIDERTGNQVIDIGNKNGQCTGLKICCKTEKMKCPPKTPKTKPVAGNTVIVPIVTTPTTPTPHQWKCGKRQADGVRVIVNGFADGQTQQGEFPWMVVVLAKDTTFIGGGSLVHPRVVLTAGHKVYQKTPDSLVARIGDWDINQQIESIDPQNIDVEKIVYHPNFNRQKHEYNVAILILKTEARYGDTVAPVCLPEPGQNFDGANCFVTGWGKDDFEGGDYQTIMKKVSVPLVGHSKCQTQLRRTRLGSEFVLHDSFTCAGGHKEDACTGDGGSPLVCPGVTNSKELVQVGVVSWGIGCGIEGNPGVYGSVAESLDFITQTIQDEFGIDVDVRLG